MQAVSKSTPRKRGGFRSAIALIRRCCVKSEHRRRSRCRPALGLAVSIECSTRRTSLRGNAYERRVKALSRLDIDRVLILIFGHLAQELLELAAALGERWSHFLRQPAKVDSPMQRTIHHEDAETVFG